MKYHANFNANNGTHWMYDEFSNNKNKLIASVRETAEGERFANGECSWSVYETSTGRCVAAGGMHNNGRRYRVPEDELCWYRI